jgi:hypothetical protein
MKVENQPNTGIMAGKQTFGTDEDSEILSFKAGVVFHLERSCLVVLVM